MGHQSDHRAGDDDDEVVARCPSSSSLSISVADETKVQLKTISLLFWSDSALSDFDLQYRQVRNELAIEKIIRQRSIDGQTGRVQNLSRHCQ